MKFKDFINEVKFRGKYQAFEKPLYESFLDFLQDYFDTDIDITLSLRKNLKNKDQFGHVNLLDIKDGKHVIILEHVPYGILGKMAHEFVHIKQIIKGELDHSPDYDFFIWKKKTKISVEDYNNIKDYKEYKKIPWEVEAYKYQETMVEIYKKSNYFKLLSDTTTEVNLRFMIDNDLVL